MNYKHIIALAAFLALPLHAQDAPAADAAAPKAACCPKDGHKGKGHKGGAGMGILAHQLVVAKYDKDGDGKLSEAEREALQADGKQIMEAKKAEMLKKLDKDGDGKVSKEERQASREEWAKAHPEEAAKREAKRAEKLKKFDKDGDGKISKEERGEIKGSCKGDCKGEGKKGEGKKGKGHHGKKGHHGQGGPAMMVVGFELIMEKYDVDKDGKLSDSEKDSMKADAKAALEAKKAAKADAAPEAPAAE